MTSKTCESNETLKTFVIPVCRTGFGFADIEAKAATLQEAQFIALDRAGDHSFSEKSSEYSLQNHSNETSGDLQNWTVRYGESGLLFLCQAENIAHAIGQCENAYPGEPVVGAILEQVNNPPVYLWSSAHYNGDDETGPEFEIQLTDQRVTNGQLFIDMAAKNGQIDDLLSMILEINRLPEGKVDTPCAHLHFDGANLAVSIYKQGDAYILRPETDVTIKQTRLPNGEYGYILE